MNFEQMKETLCTIELMEKDLMRDLSEEEKEVIVNKGWKEFLFGEDHLNLSEDDFTELKYLRELISSYYTLNSEAYKKIIKECPPSIYFTLKAILSDLEGEEEISTEQYVGKAVDVPYNEFITSFYESIPEEEKSWFINASVPVGEVLYKTYKEQRPSCTDEELCGVLLDAAKDEIVKDFIKKLKEGNTIKMTEDQYDEVVDSLIKTENKVHIVNNNGNVTLK